MSENQTLLPLLEQMLETRRKNKNLTKFQMEFLLEWFRINGDNLFGFVDIVSLEEQLDEAIDFLKERLREWEKAVLENMTSISFYRYFYWQADTAAIELPDEFDVKIRAALQGDYHELE